MTVSATFSLAGNRDVVESVLVGAHEEYEKQLSDAARARLQVAGCRLCRFGFNSFHPYFVSCTSSKL